MSPTPHRAARTAVHPDHLAPAELRAHHAGLGAHALREAAQLLREQVATHPDDPVLAATSALLSAHARMVRLDLDLIHRIGGHEVADLAVALLHAAGREVTAPDWAAGTVASGHRVAP